MEESTGMHGWMHPWMGIKVYGCMGGVYMDEWVGIDVYRGMGINGWVWVDGYGWMGMD